MLKLVGEGYPVFVAVSPPGHGPSLLCSEHMVGAQWQCVSYSRDPFHGSHSSTLSFGRWMKKGWRKDLPPFFLPPRPLSLVVCPLPTLGFGQRQMWLMGLSQDQAWSRCVCVISRLYRQWHVPESVSKPTLLPPISRYCWLLEAIWVEFL